MIQILQPSAYARVTTLFAPRPVYVFCEVVLAGNEPGLVMVDDEKAPSSAFVLARGIWGFLAGNAGNSHFVKNLNVALFEGEITQPDTFGLLITSQIQDWHARIPSICAPRPPIQVERWRFVADTGREIPAFALPAGYKVRGMDPSLLDLGISFPEDVTNLLIRRRENDNPQEVGFGVVALQDGQLAAHAMIDCIADGHGDLGLVTDEAHRLRGLGTATAAATLRKRFEWGLEVVHWDCGADNHGSVRIAQKLGLQKVATDQMFVFAFDEETHNHIAMG